MTGDRRTDITEPAAGPAPGAPEGPAPGAPENTAPVSFGFASGALAIITGAGSGIGRATALLGAAAGLDVASWDLDPGSAECTAAEIADAGGQATWAQVDVTDPAAVATGFDRLERPARYLVNNAGPAERGGQPLRRRARERRRQHGARHPDVARHRAAGRRVGSSTSPPSPAT